MDLITRAQVGWWLLTGKTIPVAVVVEVTGVAVKQVQVDLE